MKIPYTFLENIGDSVVNGLEDLVNYLDPNKHRLKGAFMSERKILSKKNTGFNINGVKNISSNLSMQGVLVNGETGSFKTAGVVVKSILSVSGSQIIHDPSKELFEKTSGALFEKGYEILQLDFSNPVSSLRYNPLVRANTKSQITQLATHLVTIQSDDATADDSFWNNKAIEVLYVLISIIKTQEKQYQSLYNIAHLLDKMQSKTSSGELDKLFSEYADEELFVKYSSIISQSSNTLSSILSTAQSCIQQFSLDENIIAITSTDNIGNFQDMRLQKTGLYIHSSTAKMRYYSKITSIFLSQYFESFFENLPTPDMDDVFFHLDELPVLSIGSLDIICSNIRKYRGAIMGVCQNAHSQLTAKYGKRADAIISNLRTKIYLSADLTTATGLERILGKYEYIDKQDNDKLKSRCVLTADEIMSLPPDKALVLVSGRRAVFTRIKPYFKVKQLQELTSLPPYKSTFVSDTNEISLLPISKSSTDETD